MAEIGYSVAMRNSAYLLDKGASFHSNRTESPYETQKRALRYYLMAFNESTKVERVTDIGNIIGDYYYYGKGTEVNMGNALEYYQKVAFTRDTHGIYNLAYMIENGYGMEKNVTLAWEWYRMIWRVSGPFGGKIAAGMAMIKLLIEMMFPWISSLYFS